MGALIMHLKAFYCWTRFRLKSFFGFVVVIALVSFWISWQRTLIVREISACKFLADNNALVYYSECIGFERFLNKLLGYPDFRHARTILLHGTNIKDEELWRLADVREMVHVSLDEGNTCLAILALVKLNHLEVLGLSNNSLTDSSLKNIGRMNALRELNVAGTTISDDDIKYIKHLKLRILSLRGTEITDKGIEQILGISSLEYLELQGTRITNLALSKLVNMPRLKSIDITGTLVTQGYVEQINKENSTLEIIYRW